MTYEISFTLLSSNWTLMAPPNIQGCIVILSAEIMQLWGRGNKKTHYVQQPQGKTKKKKKKKKKDTAAFFLFFQFWLFHQIGLQFILTNNSLGCKISCRFWKKAVRLNLEAGKRAVWSHPTFTSNNRHLPGSTICLHVGAVIWGSLGITSAGLPNMNRKLQLGHLECHKQNVSDLSNKQYWYCNQKIWRQCSTWRFWCFEPWTTCICVNKKYISKTIHLWEIWSATDS